MGFLEVQLPLEAQLFLEVQPPLEAQLFLEAQPPLEAQLFLESLLPLEAQLFLEAQLPLEAQLFLEVQPPLKAQLLLEAQLSPAQQFLLQLFLAPLVALLFLLQQPVLLHQLQHKDQADDLKRRRTNNSVYWRRYSNASINQYYVSCLLFPPASIKSKAGKINILNKSHFRKVSNCTVL